MGILDIEGQKAKKKGMNIMNAVSMISAAASSQARPIEPMMPAPKYSVQHFPQAQAASTPKINAVDIKL